MSLPKSRDPELTRKLLTEWLAGKLPEAVNVEIASLQSPKTNGFSTETILFDAAWTAAGRRHERSLVARVRPTGYSVFPEYDLDRQRRVIDVLGRMTDVPVPEVYWHEDEERSPFGQPFFVMERVDGEAPPDHPPYPAKGWLADASPAEQRELHDNALAMVARINTVDWRALGLEYLDPSGMAGELAYWRDYLDWAADGRTLSDFESAFSWLRANAPADDRVCLNWGDARIGNILFRGFTPAAVLDWEMVTLGPPEADVAWMLNFHRAWTEGRGLPDLPGFPGRDAALATYEDLSGMRLGDLHWYEVWAAFRLTVITFRLNDMMVASGALPPDAPGAPYRPSMAILNTLLETH